MKDIILGFLLMYTSFSCTCFWFWFRHLERTKQVEKIDELQDKIVKRLQELNDINESLIIFKNFLEENENDEKKKNNSTII